MVELESYVEQSTKIWPSSGKHILAQFDDDTIIVYQAFKPSIAQYAVSHKKFGGAEYKLGRMTWIKTNFLWMMYRSGWATKPNQERILAIRLTRSGFEEILRNAYTPVREKQDGVARDEINVRLQWDPDHDPMGTPVVRKAIQLGLKGNFVHLFNDSWIKDIVDITDTVSGQRNFVKLNQMENLMVPKERIYVPTDSQVCTFIGLDGIS